MYDPNHHSSLLAARRRPVVAAATTPLLLAALASAAPADGATGPAWNAFVNAVSAAGDTVETVVSNQTKGTASAKVTYKISFRKPNYARCEIVDGPGKGGISVWRGGTTVEASAGGSAPAVTFARTNPVVTDLLGNPCGATALPLIVQYWPANGTLAESAGPAVAGVETDRITFTPRAPATNGVTKEELLLSKATHLPVASKGYRGDQIIESSTIEAIATNVSLPDSTFQL